MKKLLIIFALTVLNTGIYAQKVFDEAVARAALGRLSNDPGEFFANETSSNFTIIFGNGTVSTRNDMLAMVKSMTDKYSRVEEKVTVNQVGSTAVVSGITAEKFTNPQTNAVTNLPMEHFTYTFSLVKGKWLMVAAQHTDVAMPFTKETLNEIMAEYKADSKAFMNNHLSENFRFINSKSGFQPRKDFIGGTKQSIVTTEMLDPVIFQSGNLAVTSGIHKTVRTSADGKEVVGQVGATYVWQNIGGKWMFVASQQNPVSPPNFDEATFNGMITRWGNDPAGFVKNECDPKFIFTDGNGNSYTYQQAVDTYADGFSKIDKKVENVKVWQSGSTGFATGKTIEGFKFKDGTSYIYTGIFTYTFSIQNGKWVLASAQHTDFRSPKTEDEAAIKSTIESETMAGWAHDTEKEFSYWKQAPEASWIGGAQNKAYSFVGFDKIKKTAIDMHKNVKVNLNALPVLKNSDYSININGNSAFATYVQAQTSKGKTGKTRENRYLEKSNGEWKIVNATFIVDGIAK
jgi:ketosteroid isomerase-like protein